MERTPAVGVARVRRVVSPDDTSGGAERYDAVRNFAMRNRNDSPADCLRGFSLRRDPRGAKQGIAGDAAPAAYT